MNTQVKLKIIHYINCTTKNKGFTLIELLVVIMIMGVLALITIPSVLGQINKGRQAEAKNNLGALNRAQQAYRWEYGTFTNIEANLSVNFAWKFYQLDFVNSTTTYATYYAQSQNKYQDDVLDYGAGTMQDLAGNYSQIICQELFLNSNNNNPPHFAQFTASTFSLTCDYSKSIQIK